MKHFARASIFVLFFSLIAFFTIFREEIKISRAASTTIDCSIGSPRNIAQGVDFSSGDSLTLNGSGTCVLTTVATLSSLVIGDVGGGHATVLKHQDNSPAQTYSLDITTTGDITVHSGASIDVDGLGYDGGKFGHSNGYGDGGGTGGGYVGAGGGHGGNGGNSGGGVAYCDFFNPTTIGSGGGYSGYAGGLGGTGGGLVILNASGTVTISGTITADGSSAAGFPWGGAGGAGGAVKIAADTIAGTPASFTSTGGNGSGDGGGGGGGGCIYLGYTTSNSIGSVTLTGGSGFGGSQSGSAGVLTTEKLATIDCSIGSPRNITQGVDFSSGDSLTLNGSGTCVLTTVATLSSLVIGDVGGGHATVLKHQDNSTAQTYSLDITTTGDITVHSGASIDVDGLGYDGGKFGHSNGYGDGGGTGGGYVGAGGGHGGNGGNSGGGVAYCDFFNPTTIGSGGGYSGYAGGLGGTGGGLVILNASGTVTISGTITADGSRAAVFPWGGAGGAGVAVKIVAATIVGIPASFTSTGGNGSGDGGGGGGGGCIYLGYTTSNSIGSVTLTGGSGFGGSQSGSAGVLTTEKLATIDCSIGSPRNITQGVDFSSGDSLT